MLQAATDIFLGWTQPAADGRSADAAAIAGYTGAGPAFAKAVAGFAVAYAKQTTRDWRRCCAAIDAGEIEAHEP